MHDSFQKSFILDVWKSYICHDLQQSTLSKIFMKEKQIHLIKLNFISFRKFLIMGVKSLISIAALLAFNGAVVIFGQDNVRTLNCNLDHTIVCPD